MVNQNKQVLSAIEVKQKQGGERFTGNPVADGLTLLDFWRWSGSDLLSNATRGVLAEFLVGSALGIETAARIEWDTYDLETKTGLKIEVKSSAYIQRWDQEKYSRIGFGISPTKGWDKETNAFTKDRQRRADVYVFCLLAHKDQDTINPLDVSQWRFYVVKTEVLNEYYPTQKKISLSGVKKMCARDYGFGELKEEIDRIFLNGEVLAANN